jgi:hypothetical protein
MTVARPVSRPLRAAGTVLGGWIALRTMMTWGGMPVEAQGEAPVWGPAIAPAAEAGYDPLPAPQPQEPLIVPVSLSSGDGRAAATHKLRSARHLLHESHSPSVVRSAAIEQVREALPQLETRLPAPKTIAATTLAIAPPGLPLRPETGRRNRFQLSGWALVRNAATPGGLAPGGVLGGSQIGARGWFEPGPPGLAITARVSSPLGVLLGSEASVGIGYRKGPFGVIVEERFSLDAGGGARPSVTVFGGVSDLSIRGKLRLDGYAQAGIVGLNNRTGFADGAVRVEHPVAGRTVKLSIGAGAWGGAQPGLARLDVGPQLVARVPVLGGTLRIAGEYRFRVAGNADPGSGPALSIGADF